MNSRFLASPGGRLANAALSLAFLVMAYAAFSSGGTDAVKVVAAGVVTIIVGFIIATILSVADFRSYALTILFGAPPAGFYFIFGLQALSHAGAAIGSVFATIGVFVFLAGTVLSFRTAPSPQHRPSLERPRATSGVRA